MPYTVLDPAGFLNNERFAEKTFLQRLDEYDWAALHEKKVLVRGCGSVMVPPWAYMTITARLLPYALSIRYGNEHDNVLIWSDRKADTHEQID
jgi:hypothetical protein